MQEKASPVVVLRVKSGRDEREERRERERESASAGLRAVVLRSCASKELLMR
jgi:hypothetical protein